MKGNRCRAVMALQGLGPTDLANRLCCSGTHVHRLLAGLTQPSEEHVAVMRAQFGVEAWQFILGETAVLNADAVERAGLP